jgi:pimeloyl-ACP methyl ester carboxylesterase
LRVLCLHGLGPSGPAVFDGLRAAAGDELDLSAPPFPGWEGTPAATREDYRPSALARWAEAQVDGPFALVGFSWGGTVGLRVSPERLRALVLVDVGYQSSQDEPKSYEGLLAEYADVDFAPPEAVAAGFEGVGLEPATEALPNMRDIPVLLLAATVSHVERRADDLARFAETLPTAEIRSVEGAEHNILETAAGEAIPLIRDFLRRHA